MQEEAAAVATFRGPERVKESRRPPNTPTATAYRVLDGTEP